MCKPFYMLAISICVYSCSETSVKTSPQDVIKNYERLVLEMKADSIAQLFTTDAEIGHEDQSPVKGRDSIYSFFLPSRTFASSIIMTRSFRAP